MTRVSLQAVGLTHPEEEGREAKANGQWALTSEEGESQRKCHANKKADDGETENRGLQGRSKTHQNKV